MSSRNRSSRHLLSPRPASLRPFSRRWTVLSLAGTLIGLAPIVLPGIASALTLDEVVAGLESTYGRIATLRAEFVQNAFNKTLGQDIQAEGVVYLKKPGKMRWEYRTPSPQQIVSDGTSIWVYTPELNQVNVGDAPRALAGPAGSFLAGLGRLQEEFTVRFLNPLKVDQAGNPVIDLRPKEPTPVLTRLILSVDPKQYLVRKAVLYDQFDNTVTMRFTKVGINPTLGEELFTFMPPSGVAVVPLAPGR